MLSADEASPTTYHRDVFSAVLHADQRLVEITSANHVYTGQPDKLAEGADTVRAWLADHDLV